MLVQGDAVFALSVDMLQAWHSGFSACVSEGDDLSKLLVVQAETNFAVISAQDAHLPMGSHRQLARRLLHQWITAIVWVRQRLALVAMHTNDFTVAFSHLREAMAVLSLYPEHPEYEDLEQMFVAAPFEPLMAACRMAEGLDSRPL